MTMTDILIVDKQGTPRDWVDVYAGVCYYARDKVVWEIGTPVKTFTGGKNEHGETSSVTVMSILGVSGPIFGDDFYNRETIYADRAILYSRDMHICAYCAEEFKDHQLTIDHVLPRSRGGKNTWVNTVSSCKPCNTRKAARTPEEAKMPLAYVPYAPSIFDKMILKNRKILADQMDYLMARASKNLKARQLQFN
jgi:hypothetical protein